MRLNQERNNGLYICILYKVPMSNYYYSNVASYMSSYHFFLIANVSPSGGISSPLLSTSGLVPLACMLETSAAASTF
jgi:hypothetical protein